MCTAPIPQPIDSVIRHYDESSVPFDVHDVSSALVAARQALVNPSAMESLWAWSEVLAFALADRFDSPSPWNTYFAPVSSIERGGKIIYMPDVTEADPGFIAHWTRRARTLRHPVLKARYADLVWDLSRIIAKQPGDPELARIAIDAYLASLSPQMRRESNDRFRASIRALNLSIQLNDAARVDAAKRALLALHREEISAERGLWWLGFDRLIEDKRAGVTEAERSQLIADVESIVTRRSDAGDPKQFDPHQTRDAANRLIKQYRKGRAGADVRRLQEVIGRAFEHFASLGDAMLASSVLQTAVNAYREAGLPQESQRVRLLMEERIAASHAEMKPITVDRLIPNEDMEKFLSSTIRPDIGETFALIAIQFLDSRQQLEQQVANLQTEAPLMATITQQIVADRHIAALVDSVAEDPIGRLIQHAARIIPFSDVWLINALHRAIETHNLTPEHFVGWAARTELFDDLTLLLEGVTAYFGQDFVKAVHVLIPQIESALRRLVAKLGKPTTKAHPAIDGVGVVIGMGDMLYPKGGDTEIIDALGPDLTLHFLALYADPRGLNLRNDLAHGLLRANSLQPGAASRIIHTLLLLGVWDQIAARSKRS
jgi:hypothetical protein